MKLNILKIKIQWNFYAFKTVHSIFQLKGKFITPAYILSLTKSHTHFSMHFESPKKTENITLYPNLTRTIYYVTLTLSRPHIDGNRQYGKLRLNWSMIACFSNSWNGPTIVSFCLDFLDVIEYLEPSVWW